MDQSQPLDEKKKRAVKRLQLFNLTQRLKKSYQKMKKKYRYRYNVIQEIVKTERGYVNDVGIICEQVRKVVLQQCILTHEEAQEIFINIEEIFQWNTRYLKELEAGFQNYSLYVPYQVIFRQTTELIRGDQKAFQCYFNYCSNFTKASKLLEQQLQANQKMKDFAAMLNRHNTLRGMDLASFLVKPIQRLPKYILLYKDLLKHTDDDHHDFGYIKEQLSYFGKINEENNKNMDIFMNRLIIKELCQNYGIDQQVLLGDPQRMFEFEDKLTVLQSLNVKKDEEDFIVEVHAMYDLLVLVHDKQLFKIVYLDSLSFVKNQSENNKYFSNLFQIVGVKDTIQCIADTPQQKKKSIEQYEHLIQKIRDREFKYPVQVIVVGTEERSFQSFTKHTAYITQIQYYKIKQNIYIRYSEIQKLQEKFSKIFPTIELPKFPSNAWLTGHKTKTIEERKIAIESFLQTALQAKEIQLDKTILAELRLPENFFELPEIYMKQTSSLFNKPVQKTTGDAFSELVQKGVNIAELTLSAGELLTAVEIEAQSNFMNVTAICPSRVLLWSEKLQFDPELKQLALTMPDGIKVLIAVDEKARVGEVLKFVLSNYGLKYYRDFRLALVDQLKKSRMLDEDEVVWKVYDDERRSHQGVMDKIEKLITRSDDEVVLKVRKYLYFPTELEEYDYRRDQQRLIQLAYSVFENVYEQKFNLNLNDYCLYAALYYHMKYQEKIEVSIDSVQLDKIKKVVPPEFYKTIPEKDWESTTRVLIKSLDEKISAISRTNKERLLSRKTGEIVFTEKTLVAAGVVMNSVKSNPLHAMTIYQVQTYERTLVHLRNIGIEAYPTIYLGVSLAKLSLMDPKNKKSFRDIDYQSIKAIRSYPSQIIFESDIFKEAIRFDTYLSYEIKLLIEQYQRIQNFSKEYELKLTFHN